MRTFVTRLISVLRLITIGVIVAVGDNIIIIIIIIIIISIVIIISTTTTTTTTNPHLTSNPHWNMVEHRLCKPLLQAPVDIFLGQIRAQQPHLSSIV